MIEIDRLTFGYASADPIFEGFSWGVSSGEAWCILGPSGCGKTTLLYLLAGLRRPLAGTVSIDGHSLDRPRPRTGLVLQDFGLLPWATVEENIALGLRVRGFYGPDGRHAPPDDASGQTEERVRRWLDRMGLEAVRRHYPGQLSGGQRQRTAIARTLALHPDLLLMDEPFGSLDAPTREALQDLTLQLRSEGDLTLILVTHTLEEAAFLGSRILLLGRPPTRHAEVVDNPRAGSAAFRQSSDYAELCRGLRARLGALA
jgi:NitT/TauT family transport system ATP-binding protein